jgi:HD-like signal output (HDOD) protein/prolyl-tRNA editing enzyme YbaK/EbsC (Cys-tRNA(Pro) deacylase)
MNLPHIVRNYLDRRRIPYRLITCTAGDSLIQIAAQLAISSRQMVRVALLKDDVELIMAILPCSYVLDFSMLCQALQRDLEPLYGVETSHFFQERGCNSGSHPPLPEAFGIPALVDHSLAHNETDEIYFDGGCGNALVEMRGSDFRQLLNQARWEHFAVPTDDLDALISSHQELTPQYLSCFTHRYTPARVCEGIEAITELPEMPPIAQQILALRNNHQTTLRDLLALVEQHPNLAAQVVYCARSPLQGHYGAVTSLETTIERVLGIETTLNLLLSASMGQAFDIPADGPMGLHSFWRHSVYCAALVSELVNVLPDPVSIKPGLAYLCGLLHDFGYLVLGHALPARFFVFNRFLTTHRNVSLQAIERYVLGVEHWHIGAWLMHAWNLPEELIVAARWHHSDDCTRPHAEYSNLVLIANRLLSQIGMMEERNNRLPALALFTLGLTRDQAMEALVRVESRQTELDALAETLRWVPEE